MLGFLIAIFLVHSDNALVVNNWDLLCFIQQEVTRYSLDSLESVYEPPSNFPDFDTLVGDDISPPEKSVGNEDTSQRLEMINITMLQLNLSSLKHKVYKMDEEMVKANAFIKKAKAENEHMSSEIQFIADNKEKLEHDRQNNIEKLTNEMASSEKTLKATMAFLQQKLDSSTNEMKGRYKVLADAIESVQQIQVKHDGLSKQLSEQEKMLGAMPGLKTKNEQLQAQMVKMTEENKKNSISIDELTKVKNDLELKAQQLDKFKEEKARLNSENKNLEDELAKITSIRDHIFDVIGNLSKSDG